MPWLAEGPREAASTCRESAPITCPAPQPRLGLPILTHMPTAPGPGAACRGLLASLGGWGQHGGLGGSYLCPVPWARGPGPRAPRLSV